MGRYRKIEIRTWADDKFLTLSSPSPNGQTLWFYLLTGPHTNSIPGLFVIGKSALAEALKWDETDDLLDGFRKAFQELLDAKMIRFDQKTRLVWIPKAIKYNLPESPNVIRSWKGQVRELPESILLTEALCSIRNTVYGMGEGFQKGFDEVFGKGLPQPSPNQEQEQEQEQEEEFADPPKADQEKKPPEDSKPKEAQPSLLSLPPSLKLTPAHVAEALATFGDRTQEALDMIALKIQAHGYAYAVPWAGAKTWFPNSGGPMQWLDKVTGRSSKPESQTQRPEAYQPLHTTHESAGDELPPESIPDLLESALHRHGVG